MSLLERAFAGFLRHYHFYGKTVTSRLVSGLAGDLYLQSAYGPLIRYRHGDITWAGCFFGYRDSVVPGELASIPRGGCFIDIGANIGVFSLLCARLLGGDGVVVSFEINPSTFTDLVRNVARNRPECAMIPFNVGLSDRCEGARVSDNPRHSGSSHVLIPGEPGLAAVTCDWGGIRWLEGAIGRRPTYVKIDVEGMELQVLRGMASFLDGPLVQKVIVEIDDQNLERFGGTRKDVYALMAARGFKPKYESPRAHYDEVFTRE
jgi:FkbM family methyltransferase